MRNTKLIVAMLAGCMAFAGASMAQDASKSASPTPASTAGSQTQMSNDTMKQPMSNGSMSNDSKSMSSDKAADSNGSMKSNHKKHKKASTTGTEPAKSSSSGM